MRKSEYPKEIKTMGQWIKKLRLDQKLTLRQVAEDADITEGYLSRLENDKQIPTQKTAIKIANKLKDTKHDPYYLWALKSNFKQVYKHLTTLPSSAIESVIRKNKLSKKEIEKLPNTQDIIKIKKKLLKLAEEINDYADEALFIVNPNRDVDGCVGCRRNCTIETCA